MMIFLAFAALLATANGCGVPDVTGRTMGMTRIVGGEEATAHSWPWQVSMQDSTGFHYCGGVLISPNFVLCAAHCYQSSHTSHSVVLGEHDRYSGDESIPVQTIGIRREIRHTSYNSQTISNDIMLVELESPATLNSHVSVACLPEQGETHNTVSEHCWITGWGRLGSNQNSAAVLQQANIPLLTNSQCRGYWGSNYRSSSMVCAGAEGQGGCMGDSGGPFVCEKNNAYDLVGLVSWGSSSCSTSLPTVFTRVAAYRDWIRDNTGI